MALKLNKFQDMQFKGWAPILTKKNHISAMYMANSQQAADVMIELHASRVGNNIDSYLSKFPTKYFPTSDPYTWQAKGKSRRNVPLVEARNENGSVVTNDGSMVGAYQQRFSLVFRANDNLFHKGEVVVGSLNEIYPMRIIGDLKNEGTNVVFTVELMGNNPAGIPAELLLAGELFSKEYAPVEKELSRRVGGISHSSPIAMQNEFSTIRIGHKVTGEMLFDKMLIGIPVVRDNGKTDVITHWMHEVEYEFEQEWSNYKINLLAYGRSNRDENGEYHNFGESGEVIRMGMGLYEQREVANFRTYEDFSLKLLEDAAYKICTNKIAFNKRILVLRTGEMGARLFHKAVMDTASGWLPMMNQGLAIGLQQASSPLHTNAYSAGMQFTEWKAANGVIFRLEIDPMYDDEIRNKIQHPMGGPASSYRFDLFDLGDERDVNIQKVAVEGDPEYRGYTWGFRNPFTGQKENFNMSHDEDSATIHRMTTTGVIVWDPTKTFSLVPSILVTGSY